jgi:hypothetical protein
MTIGGEKAKQDEGFGELTIVLVMSVVLIFLALVSQFNHAVKPLLVFAAVPYGVVGALAALYIMRTPFGFMAFLGIVSLVGVIVSHVIVLFDFIEEMHEKGEPLIDSLLDAGSAFDRHDHCRRDGVRYFHWLCTEDYRNLVLLQIGGQRSYIRGVVARSGLIAIFVLDLKIVKWEEVQAAK